MADDHTDIRDAIERTRTEFAERIESLTDRADLSGKLSAGRQRAEEQTRKAKKQAKKAKKQTAKQAKETKQVLAEQGGAWKATARRATGRDEPKKKRSVLKKLGVVAAIGGTLFAVKKRLGGDS